MHILSTLGFQKIFEQRLKLDFDSVAIDDINKLQWYGVLDGIKHYVDVDLYYKIMGYISPNDHHSFHRFYNVCLRKYFLDEFNLERSIDWIDIKRNNKLQVLYIICMQYYFS